MIKLYNGISHISLSGSTNFLLSLYGKIFINQFNYSDLTKSIDSFQEYLKIYQFNSLWILERKTLEFLISPNFS